MTHTYAATKRLALPTMVALLLLLGLTAGRPSLAGPTSLTYTGQILTSTAPPTALADGLYDMQFKLWTATTGGAQAGPTVSVASVPVAGGVYYVQLNFGNVFSGTTYWIETSYKVAGSGGPYTVITPRPIAPNSAFADYATLSGNTLALQGKGVSATAPTSGQVLTYSGTAWAPAALPAPPTYTAGSGLTLSGNAFSVAVPLNLNGASSSPILQANNTNTGSGYGLYGSSAANNYAAIRGDGTGGAWGVDGNSDTANGVYGGSASGTGVYGKTTSGTNGVYGESDASGGNGGYFTANNGSTAYGVEGASSTGYGVVGEGASYGVYGNGATSGVYGASGSNGVYGQSSGGNGVYGQSSSGPGVYAQSAGTSLSSPALRANNTNSSGIGIYTTTNSSDANLVVQSFGTGDLIRGFYGSNNLYFRVTAGGTTITRQLQITGGADVAEPYTVAPVDGVTPQPGMVVAIDPARTGQMTLAHVAYDRRVAGIVSGAGGIAPGLTLRQKGSVADGGLPVACTGRVWCWCDAAAGGPITAGDLLAASATPGHAMKAADDHEVRGAILGKAMSSLTSGKGLVLVLVTLE